MKPHCNVPMTILVQASLSECTYERRVSESVVSAAAASERAAP